MKNFPENSITLKLEDHAWAHKLLEAACGIKAPSTKWIESQTWTPERCARNSAAKKKYYEDPEARARHAEARRTPEARARQSAAHRGKKLSEEHRRKLSDAKRGKKLGPFSEEHRRKLSDAKRGHAVSRDARRKIGDAVRGKNWRVSCFDYKNLSHEQRVAYHRSWKKIRIPRSNNGA